MKVIALTRRGAGVLEPLERATPYAGEGQVLVRVGACGVCRTDLHVVDDELPHVRVPIVPGHEIVGRVEQVGTNVSDLQQFARSLGAVWAGGSNEAPPAPLGAAIIFAPVGALAPKALSRVQPGGTLVCAGIHVGHPDISLRAALG